MNAHFDGWQPIQSAPRGKYVRVGCFSDQGSWQQAIAADWESDQLQIYGWHDENRELNFSPTHWRSLDSSPDTSIFERNLAPNSVSLTCALQYLVGAIRRKDEGQILDALQDAERILSMGADAKACHVCGGATGIDIHTVDGGGAFHRAWNDVAKD